MQTDSHDERLRQSSENRRWRFPIVLSAWLMLIFGTSCTVIRPLEFFELLQSLTGADRTSMERFGVFWGISWFAIVKGWHFTEFAILTFICVGVIKWWRGFVDSGSIFKCDKTSFYLVYFLCALLDRELDVLPTIVIWPITINYCPTSTMAGFLAP